MRASPYPRALHPDWLDVQQLLPATGWVAVFADDKLPGGFFTTPLLFWAILIDEEGHRVVDAFTEPSPEDGTCAFLDGVLATGNFVCYAQPHEIEADPERFTKLAGT